MSFLTDGAVVVLRNSMPFLHRLVLCSFRTRRYGDSESDNARLMSAGAGRRAGAKSVGLRMRHQTKEVTGQAGVSKRRQERSEDGCL